MRTSQQQEEVRLLASPRDAEQAETQSRRRLGLRVAVAAAAACLGLVVWKVSPSLREAVPTGFAVGWDEDGLGSHNDGFDFDYDLEDNGYGDPMDDHHHHGYDDPVDGGVGDHMDGGADDGYGWQGRRLQRYGHGGRGDGYDYGGRDHDYGHGVRDDGYGYSGRDDGYGHGGRDDGYHFSRGESVYVEGTNHVWRKATIIRSEGRMKYLVGYEGSNAQQEVPSYRVALGAAYPWWMYVLFVLAVVLLIAACAALVGFILQQQQRRQSAASSRNRSFEPQVEQRPPGKEQDRSCSMWSWAS